MSADPTLFRQIDYALVGARLQGEPRGISEAAAKIAHMIVSTPRVVLHEMDAHSRLQRRRALDAHTAELGERRARLALAFGEARGWRVSPSDFDEATLAAGKVNAGRRRRHYGAEWGGFFLDHLTFYRGPDRRAAAVVAQPYPNGVWTEEEARSWADEHGLRATFPDGFPSWHYPGRTRLVLIEPAILPATSAPATRHALGRG